ncbi:MAG: hypothetical protein J2P37_17150 [Ktedonobacteraceae bacterium]|nr:hypothetical protein [Ktedonobacteraceae bacterium]
MSKRHYDLLAALVIFLGALFRLALITLGWPAPYNDEGTMGLMARHIAYQGAHPLLYYGQDYLGSLEAYLGAFFFRLFGPSTLSLRLGLVLLSVLFLWCMYRLVSLLYNRALAVFTLIVLALGSSDVMLRQLIASGVVANPLFWTALLLLLTSRIVLTARPISDKLKEKTTLQDRIDAEHTSHMSWSRLALYAAWGAVAGITLWSHFLFIPFVLCAAVLLLWACRQELRLPALSLLVLCFLIGLSPLLIYKITVPVSPYENSMFAGIVGGGYREPSYPPIKGLPTQSATISPKPITPVPGLQVLGTLLVAVPTATNGTVFCPIVPANIWPLTNHSDPSTLFCTGVHGAWGLTLVVLGGIATITAVKRIRQLRPTSSDRDPSVMNYERRRWAARLTLLAGGGLTLLAFVLYPQASAITPLISARYLVSLLIALPAVLFPLWEAGRLLKPARQRQFKVVSYLLHGLLLLAVLVGSATLFVRDVPQAQASSHRQQILIDGLLQAHDTRIYADYENCNRISFLSNEQIICAALDKGLHPGLDRYFPYRAIVAQAPRPAYVLQKNSTQAFLFEQKAASLHIAYKKIEIAGYIVYEPEKHMTP